MFLKKLDLRNFRNYKQTSIDFTKTRYFIRGGNGEGKTNILEAIYYLSQTRSFKKADDDELIEREMNFAFIQAIFCDDQGDHNVSVIIERNKGRVFEIDSVKKSSAVKVIGTLLALVYEPQMVFLFKEDPQARRKLLDETLSPIDSQYLYALGRYKKYLKERNQALVTKFDRDVIKVLTLELVQCSYRIYLLRDRFIKRLDKEVNTLFKELDNSQHEIHLIYKTNVVRSREYEEYVKEMISLFESNLSEDVTRKITLRGIHRDDIQATFDGLELGTNGSQGQNRLVTIAIKLAVARLIADTTKQDPILLLDDLSSDLDDLHLDRLLKRLETYPGQIFVTGCNRIKGMIGYEELVIRNNSIERRS